MSDLRTRELRETLRQLVSEYTINDVVLELSGVCFENALISNPTEGKEAWQHDGRLLEGVYNELGNW